MSSSHDSETNELGINVTQLSLFHSDNGAKSLQPSHGDGPLERSPARAKAVFVLMRSF